jgi:sialic acid synthase
MAALALEAEILEPHFTLDRIWKGIDHAASLRPDGMRCSARDLRNACKSFTSKSSGTLPVARVQGAKLKY